MALNDKERETVVELEKAKALRFYQQAERQMAEEVYDLAANRYYYACFHIVQALLIKNGLFAKTHSGLIQVFSEHFIKSGKLSEENGTFLSRMMNLRQKADYNCYYNLTEKDIEMCRIQSPLFIKAVTELL